MLPPNAPAFTGSADPKGLVRVLRRQLDGLRRQLRGVPLDSARYDALSQRVAETEDAIARAAGGRNAAAGETDA